MGVMFLPHSYKAGVRHSSARGSASYNYAKDNMFVVNILPANFSLVKKTNDK